MTLLLIHLAATLFMTGLVWFVQIVHYPLFARVGSAEFSQYETLHTRSTSFIVGPMMLIEGVTGVWLLLSPPAAIPSWPLRVGAGLIVVIWLSTALLQVPQHRILSAGFDAAAHRRLVGSNWLRTVAWSIRSGLVAWTVASAGTARL